MCLNGKTTNVFLSGKNCSKQTQNQPHKHASPGPHVAWPAFHQKHQWLFITAHNHRKYATTSFLATEKCWPLFNMPKQNFRWVITMCFISACCNDVDAMWTVILQRNTHKMWLHDGTDVRAISKNQCQLYLNYLPTYNTNEMPRQSLPWPMSSLT